MKNTLLIAGLCLLLQAFPHFSSVINAQSAQSDTLSWSWEVSSTASTHTKSLTLAFKGSLLINWGDGISELVPDTMSSKVITHVYQAQSNYFCSAVGSELTYFKADSKRVLSIETSKSPNLNYLSFSSSQVKSVDLTGNPALVSLYCSGNDIESLDLSKNLLLQTLTCSDNKIKKLDLSMLSLLKKATIHTNPLMEINVNSAGALNYLSCINCNLSAGALDSIFNQLPVLQEVSTSKNLYILNNPGSSACHTEIAVNKKWTIDRVITQSSFYIPTVSCRLGDSLRVSVNLKNVSPAIAFEMDILIPAGFSLDTIRTSLVSVRKGSHILSITKNSSNPALFKILAYSLKSKDTFKGTDGSILDLYVKASSSINSYALDIQNAILVDTLTNSLELSVSDGIINVNAAALMGDADGDSDVNVTDVVYLVAWINGRNPQGFQTDAADLDFNGKFNIIDITKMIEIINSVNTTGGSYQVSMRKKTDARALNLFNEQGSSTGNHMYMKQSDTNPMIIDLYMKNVDIIQAFQVDVLLPDNCGFKQIDMVSKSYRSKNHSLSVKKISEIENKWRIIAYSLKSGDIFTESEGIVASLDIIPEDCAENGVYPLFMDNPVVTNIDMNSLVPSIYDTELSITKNIEEDFNTKVISGKGQIMITGEDLIDAAVFNLSGNKITSLSCYDSNNRTIFLKPGFYIVELVMSDGKKRQEKVIVF